MGFKWLPGVFAFLVDVEPGEVMQVLEGLGRRQPRRVRGPLGESLLAVCGRTEAGRPIVAYVRHAEGFDWHVVAARPMAPGEKAEFEEWEGQQ